MPAKSYLSNVLDWALLQKAPVGLVVKAGEGLCSPGRTMSLADRDFVKSLPAILSDTRYKSKVIDGVMQIMPLDLNKEQAKMLGVKFDTFHSISTSMNGLGMVLSGWLFAKNHLGVGYGGNIAMSDSSEIIAPFTIENPTLAQVANHIVALGGKGLWILIL